MPRLNKPSLKQRKFAKAYVANNGNATQAAIEAYDVSNDSAEVIGSQNLNKPMVLAEINKILDKTGFNDDQYIADNLIRSIDSGIGVKSTNKDALQALNMMLKIKNVYPGNKSSTLKVSVKANLSQEQVSELIPKLKALSIKSNELIEDIS